MNEYNEIHEYLYEKISRVNTNNPKANAGGCILKLLEWEDNLPALIRRVAELIQYHFTKINTRDVKDDVGRAKLTATSTTIGEHVLLMLDPNRFTDEDTIIDRWKDKINVGDLFIEGFKVFDYIELEYSKIRDGSYVIVAGSNWERLETEDEYTLSGTSIVEPKAIISAAQRVVTPDDKTNIIKIIKRRKEPFELEQPWVRAINSLQQVKWRINRRVFNALLDNEELFISREKESNREKEIRRRSKVGEWNFITAKGKRLRDYDKFYQYLDADYRGRLYYNEPFLNFQGSDLARGMLRFAEEKEMTEEGLQWLAIHTASSYNMSYKIDEIPEWCEGDYIHYLKQEKLDSISVDKMTLSDRIQWCNEYMDTILEAGRGHNFFMNAEKPVTFLACCIEWNDYSNALYNEEPFYTSLPVPIDGSNNGWQHLGAMSKDEKTGKLVGLIPSEIQDDFYVQTAKKLIELTADGHLSSILSSMPMKHIRKGISKRGSMTRAYSAGAGKIGENMWFDCRTEDYDQLYGITSKDCMHLAKTLVKAINKVCPGPLKTMDYLQELAAFEIGKYKNIEGEFKLIYGKGADYLTWSTPSGFEVEYTKWLHIEAKHRARITGKQIKHVAKLASDRPDIRGFMCGISPNYVHSMDAAHMAIVIDRWDQDFCAVHDSFATHAPDVENLIGLTKEVFIEIYDKDNYFDTIRKEITNNEDEVEQPNIGSLNIQEIRDSDYFFA